MYKEYTSIFHEEVIIQELVHPKYTTVKAESRKQYFNRLIDACLKTDKELESINKRIPKIEKLIKETKRIIKCYDDAKPGAKYISDKYRRRVDNYESLFSSLLAVTILAGINTGSAPAVPVVSIALKKENEHLKGKVIKKTVKEYESAPFRSDHEYALKQLEKALEVLKERKRKLEEEESKKKAKHESFFLDDIDII